MFEYQENKTFFAQVTNLMEDMAEQELIELGAKNTKKVYRGIYFEASLEDIYRINYNSRLLSRVLAPMVKFYCDNQNVLLKVASKIPWEEVLSLKKTFAINASVSMSRIDNSLYAAMKLKDGIADYFNYKYKKRPNVDTVSPDVRINLHIEKNDATISLDCSGDSLHKRGYRLLAGEAPMQETLAAAIIKISKWDGEKPLLDCMCGSGTILSEALMHYCRLPAQILRKKFGFMNMPEFNREVWENTKKESEKNIRPLIKGIISGSDISGEAIQVAESNLSRLPYHEMVSLQRRSFEQIDQFENGTLITNPPYGIRLGKLEEVQALYKSLGDFIKQKCKGTTAFIYTGEASLRKHIGLKASKKIPLNNGKLEGILMQIDSYEGSKKKKYETS